MSLTDLSALLNTALSTVLCLVLGSTLEEGFKEIRPGSLKSSYDDHRIRIILTAKIV